MGKPEEPYIRIIVENYRESSGGLHGVCTSVPSPDRVYLRIFA
jgi:hypothetical protein